ncbi:MAG: amino acid adenylation domain-containing protein [Candidatus Omnitrophota bacterium]
MREFSGKIALAASKYGIEKDYWLKQLAGEWIKSSFPYDYNIAKNRKDPSIACKSDRIHMTLGNPLVERIIKISKTSDYMIHMILVAGVVSLIGKYTGHKDIIVGTPIYKSEIEGEFLNTALALRNELTDEMSFKELLLQVRQTVIEADKHQNYPIETLIYHLDMTFTGSDFPLFDIVVLLENIHQKKDIMHTCPNVIFSFSRNENQIEGTLEYNPCLYQKKTIEKIIAHFIRLLEEAVFNIDTPVLGIDTLSTEEKEKLLYGFNDTHAEYPRDKTIHRIFEEQVTQGGDRIAVVGAAYGVGADPRVCPQLTYHELNEQSNRLAYELIQKGVQPDTIIGIKIERSIEMIIGILGILKAGGAYLPIDPDYPQERIDYMLKDSGASLLLTGDNEENWNYVGADPRVCPNLTCFEKTPGAHTGAPLYVSLPPATGNRQPATSLAYVIYTSGTTGQPKGALIEHGNVVRLLFNDKFQFDFSDRDVWTLFHSYCFDFSVWEMYGALLYGGKLQIVSKMMAMDAVRFLGLLSREAVSVLNQTPQAFYHLINIDLSSAHKLYLKYVIFGGEALNPLKLKDWQQKYPQTRLINMFGITETTVHVTYKEIHPTDIELNISNIGQPIPTLSTYILDNHLKPVPLGVTGEIVVGGAGVSRGYLNRVELTQEKFIDNPYKTGDHMYRSGDMGRFLENGDMEYLGRIDHQVKIRGFRIELGEIENRLLAHPAVKEAVVDARTDSTGDTLLVAYPIPNETVAFTVCRLLEIERNKLAGGIHYFELPNGMPVFYLNRNEIEFMYREIFEESAYLKYGIVLEKGACIFDIGANIGLFSLFVNRLCQDARIYCFEPAPPLYEVLALNTSLYGTNFKVFKNGISSKEEEVTFTYYPNVSILSGCFADNAEEKETVKAFIHHELETAGDDEKPSEEQINELLEERLSSLHFTCEMKTVSQVMRENNVERIDLLKIDVEKAELGVLEGIEDADWPKIRQLVIEVHDSGGRLNKIMNLLEGHGYRIAVEQASMLEATGLYNLYATRELPGREQEPQGETEAGPIYPVSYSPERLIEDLREFLKGKLPDYMLPSHVVLLDQIPLTANGKLDRKALPKPELKAGASYMAPRDTIEKKMVSIWSDVLGVEKEAIGIDNNFFELGGHSLKATLLTIRIHKEFNVKIPLAEIFKKPSIRELSANIKETAAQTHESIKKAEEKEYYALSSAQKRLYVLQQMAPENVVYNVPLVLILEGVPEKEKFEESIGILMTRHESMRTSFILVDNVPVQKIWGSHQCPIEYGLASEEADISSPHWADSIIRNFIRPFDLSKAPLIRVKLVQVEKNLHMLMIDMHHIITDGTSMQLLFREFRAAYAGKELPPLKLQYKDYSEWQFATPQQEVIGKQEKYWLNRFEGEVPVLHLPTDDARPTVQSFEGSLLHVELSDEQTGTFNQWVSRTGATLYMVLLAAYNVFLSKLSGQEDIVVGTPIAARRHVDLECIIGMFVNTLAMRNHPRGDMTVKTFLNEVKETAFAAFENQEYPFEELVERVTVNRDFSRNPLFDVVLSLPNMTAPAGDIPQIELIGLNVKEYEPEHRITKFDLSLHCNEINRKLIFTFEYSTRLFKPSTIERFMIYFKKIISGFIENSERKISEIEMIPEEEKSRILYDFNQTTAAYPKDKTIHQLFEEQVTKRLDRIAVIDDAYGVGAAAPRVCPQLTYTELNEQSDRLAHELIQRGVQPDTIIGIKIERSIEMIIGILGILKAGGAYLPIDPDYPKERIDYMIKDSGAALLLTSDNEENWNYVGADPRVCPNLACFEKTPGAHTGAPLHVSLPPATGNRQPATSLAYVIYTSGTTGQPKGALIDHRNVVRLFFNDRFQFDFSDRDIWTLFHSSCFDFSVWEMYGALLYGGKLLIISKMMARDTTQFLKLLNREAVTVLNQTPQAFYNLIHIDLNSAQKLYLKYVIFGGEALNPFKLKDWQKKYPQTRFINMFGITETTVHVTYKEMQPSDIELSISNIGKPIPTLSSYILDRSFKPVPIGVMGEIVVGGAGVSRGYLNLVELTKEKFITNPFKPGERLYRSGDTGRFLENGDMEYFGRIDHQVKIRGFRIELGEIENRLLRHENIKETIVICKTDRAGESSLCAYMVCDRDIPVPELREFLSERLPEYMIPSYFISIDKIPLSSNGKINRNALPEPDRTSGDCCVVPRDETEKKLVALWSEVLNIDPKIIGIENSFFDLGGHSLKATILASKIKGAFKIEMPLVEIFKTPTVKALAQYIRSTEIKTLIPEDGRLVKLKDGRDRNRNLFLIHDGTGEVEGYIEFCKHITGDFNIWGIRADRLEDLATREVTIPELAHEYIETIKRIQPDGPYAIAGWSLGGTIAFEMAVQWEAMNESLNLLTLIDSPPPAENVLVDAVEINLESEFKYIKNSITEDEAIYYMNMAGVLNHARESYEPSRPIHTLVYYISASESKHFEKKKWEKYIAGDIQYHEVAGNHFSIFKQPQVLELAGVFSSVMGRCRAFKKEAL